MKGCIDHVFVSEEGFDAAMNEQKFAATIRPFDLPYRYGLPNFSHLRNDGVVHTLLLRSFLKDQIKTLSPKSLVYQIETDIDISESRMGERDVTSAGYGSRLEKFETERDLGRKIADRVFKNNGDFQTVAAKVENCLRQDFQAVLY